MAKLAIITHAFDIFFGRHLATGEMKSPYLLFDVLKHLETMGHQWQVTNGPTAVSGDVALLHVDCTRIGEEYLALASNYAATINFGTGDISKRRISRMLLDKGDEWDGPVIVKADLNCGGMAEVVHNRRARQRGGALPHLGITPVETYRLLDRVGDVEEHVWDDPAYVVERFVPELDEGGYAYRTWVFMGPRERCNRFVTPKPIGKAADSLSIEPVEVPPELRAERERLGFDFGKFDWLVHDGTPILLDANRTPGTAQAIEGMMSAGAKNLAEGLDALIRERL